MSVDSGGLAPAANLLGKNHCSKTAAPVIFTAMQYPALFALSLLWLDAI